MLLPLKNKTFLCFYGCFVVIFYKFRDSDSIICQSTRIFWQCKKILCFYVASKIIKTEFAFDRIFESLEQLKLELRSYVLWYNNKRIHSALGYMTPVEYRISNMTE